MSKKNRAPIRIIPPLDISDVEFLPTDVCLLPVVLETPDPLQPGLDLLRQIFDQMCAAYPGLGSVTLVNPKGDVLHYTLGERQPLSNGHSTGH